MSMTVKTLDGGGRPTIPRQRIAMASETVSTLMPGLLLSGMIAMAASFMAGQMGGPTMLYALLFGIALNFLSQDEKCAPGIAFAAKAVLRFGVALLGARIILGDVIGLGLPTVLLVVTGVAFTITAGWGVGRLLGLKSDHAVLSAGAVAICGASAALAISAVLPQHKHSERNTILTIVGVTALSTVAMVLYPVLTQALGFDHQNAAVFLGATIHDVAQVVGAGYMISDETGQTATLVKLMRVVCLVPAVLLIGLVLRGANGEQDVKPPVLPAFLIGFIILLLMNSAGLFPSYVTEFSSDVSRACLVTAVAALGLKTSLKDIVSVGPTPAAVLCLQTVLLALFALSGLYLFAIA